MCWPVSASTGEWEGRCRANGRHLKDGGSTDGGHSWEKMKAKDKTGTLHSLGSAKHSQDTFVSSDLHHLLSRTNPSRTIGASVALGGVRGKVSPCPRVDSSSPEFALDIVRPK